MLMLFCEFLNEKFPQSWIGRRGWKAWPHRHPDLNLLEFAYEAILNTLFYSSNIQTIEHLQQQQIKSTVESVTPTIETSPQSVKYLSKV